MAYYFSSLIKVPLCIALFMNNLRNDGKYNQVVLYDAYKT